jgi:KDO2-lipid IV(A) lauroyltransferase
MIKIIGIFVKQSLVSANLWGKLLGRLIYLFDMPNRRVGRNNLKFAFPDWTPQKIEMNIKRVYQHFGISALELLQTAFMSRKKVIEQSRITGENYLYQALKKGKGVILVSAHIGNWEIGLHFLTCRFARPIILVTRKFRPKLLNNLYAYLRTRFGNRIIDSKGAFNKMVGTLRQGGILALMADVPRKKYSVGVNFFGRFTRSAYAVALLAIQCNSPVIPTFAFRNADGFIYLELGAPVDISNSGKLRTDLQVNTQRITDIVEEAIRSQPDQYLWMQKRWKDYYPWLYPSYRAHRKRSSMRNLEQPSRLN